MIIRTADAVGVNGVVVCDIIFSPKVVRSTRALFSRMPICWDMDIDDVLSVMDKQGIETLAAVVDSDAYDIKNYSFSKNCAVLIGNEGSGLDSDVIQKCNTPITIKMNGNINSLNAAMAAGIIMWELMK